MRKRNVCSILFRNDLECIDTGYYSQFDIYYTVWDEASILDEFWENFMGLQEYIHPYFMIRNPGLANLYDDPICYVISDGDAVKIGRSSKFNTRLSMLQTGCSKTLVGVICIKCANLKDMKQTECELHQRFEPQLIKDTRATEWFDMSVADVLIGELTYECV